MLPEILDPMPGETEDKQPRRSRHRCRVDMPGDVSGADAADTWTAAHEALAQFRELMASGKTLETQRAAISMGVLIDRAGSWRSGLRSRTSARSCSPTIRRRWSSG
jgi:hypothetical protein